MARLTSVRGAIGDHHLSCEQSAPFQPLASWGRAAVLFAIARQTQLTARSAIENPGMAEHERGRVSIDFLFEEPRAVVSRRESLSHRIGCEIIPSHLMTTACVVI